jgi:hypothetical protein
MPRRRPEPPDARPPAPRRRFKLLQAALGASESGTAALGYALALAAALMFVNSIAGGLPHERSVTPGDTGVPPSR